MNHDTTCKICRKPLTVEIDDAYTLSDPHKLIPMATCNRCYDFRERREKLHESIGKICTRIDPQNNPNTQQIAKSREILEALTKKYDRYCADFNSMRGGLWSNDFVNLLIERPRLWQKILQTHRAEWRRQAQQPAQTKQQQADP